MWASTLGDLICAASPGRLRSFHAGSVLRNPPGVLPDPYQPTPTPCPLVVCAPSWECRLCTTRESCGLSSRSSRSTGAPEYASAPHMTGPPRRADPTPTRDMTAHLLRMRTLPTP